MHNAVSTGVGIATTLAVGALVSNPAGWAILAGAAAGTVVTGLFNLAYDNNFLGLKDDLDYVGKKIDDGLDYVGKRATEFKGNVKKTVSNIVHHPGEAIKRGLDAINPFG